MRSGGLVATASSGPVQVSTNLPTFSPEKAANFISFLTFSGQALPPDPGVHQELGRRGRFSFLHLSSWINLHPFFFHRIFPHVETFQEWQSSLYSLLQNQTFNQVEVDLFELMCKVLDQNLFAQVDWARNSYYFKELKVGTNQAQFSDKVIPVGPK